MIYAVCTTLCHYNRKSTKDYTLSLKKSSIVIFNSQIFTIYLQDCDFVVREVQIFDQCTVVTSLFFFFKLSCPNYKAERSSQTKPQTKTSINAALFPRTLLLTVRTWLKKSTKKQFNSMNINCLKSLYCKRIQCLRHHHSTAHLPMGPLDDISACLVHSFKELPHVGACWLYQRSIDHFVWMFFSQEWLLASASPLPADNTTLAAPPLHKLIKICLLFFILLQLTSPHTLSAINPELLSCTNFRSFPRAVIKFEPILGFQLASPDKIILALSAEP